MPHGNFSDTIKHLQVRWEGTDKLFLRQIFPLLAAGRAVPVAPLAELVNRSVADVELELSKARVDRDPQGNITELFGVSLSPTLHRVQVDDFCFFTCCALVAHMVPFLTKRMAKIESVDPVTHRLVSLTASPFGVHSQPLHAVGTLVVTSQEEVLSDIRSAFCTHVRHFPDQNTAHGFIAADPRRYIVTISELHQAARKLTHAIWE